MNRQESIKVLTNRLRALRLDKQNLEKEIIRRQEQVLNLNAHLVELSSSIQLLTENSLNLKPNKSWHD